MTGLLIAMFGGVLVITRLAGIVPVAGQTTLSQLARLDYGDEPAAHALLDRLMASCTVLVGRHARYRPALPR